MMSRGCFISYTEIALYSSQQLPYIRYTYYSTYHIVSVEEKKTFIVACDMIFHNFSSLSTVGFSCTNDIHI